MLWEFKKDEMRGKLGENLFKVAFVEGHKISKDRLTLKGAGLLGVESTLFETSLCGAHKFHPTTTISISYETCDVYLSLLVWPQQLREVTGGKGKTIIENHR